MNMKTEMQKHTNLWITDLFTQTHLVLSSPTPSSNPGRVRTQHHCTRLDEGRLLAWSHTALQILHFMRISSLRELESEKRLKALLLSLHVTAVGFTAIFQRPVPRTAEQRNHPHHLPSSSIQTTTSVPRWPGPLLVPGKASCSPPHLPACLLAPPGACSYLFCHFATFGWRELQT